MGDEALFHDKVYGVSVNHMEEGEAGSLGVGYAYN